MKNIFILDDSDIISNIIQFTLESKQIKCHLFKDAEDLIEQLDINPDIILIDHHLSNKNGKNNTGLGLLHQLRKIKNTSEIIIISGQTDPNIALEYITNGVTLYMNKEHQDFLDQVKSTISTITNSRSQSELINMRIQSLNTVKSMIDDKDVVSNKWKDFPISGNTNSSNTF
jgi:FixJ family two-component response regulator